MQGVLRGDGDTAWRKQAGAAGRLQGAGAEAPPRQGSGGPKSAGLQEVPGRPAGLLRSEGPQQAQAL